MRNGFCNTRLAPWLIGIVFLAASIAAKAEPPSESAASPKADGQKTRADLLRELEQRTAEIQKASAALEARIATDVERARKDDVERARKDEQQPYSVISKNFVVGAVGRSFSEALLAKAESLREEI